jgi:hypothetical protein
MAIRLTVSVEDNDLEVLIRVQFLHERQAEFRHLMKRVIKVSPAALGRRLEAEKQAKQPAKAQNKRVRNV